MKQRYFLILLPLAILLLCVLPVCGQNAETASTGNPAFGKINETIDCGEDIKLHILEQPVLSNYIYKRLPVNSFLLVKVMFEYIGDETWDALDRSSFELIYSSYNETKTYPVDYTTTAVASKIGGGNTFLEDIEFPTRYTYFLVFDVERAKYSWTLHFAPKARGSETPVCDLMLPLPRLLDNTGIGSE